MTAVNEMDFNTRTDSPKDPRVTLGLATKKHESKLQETWHVSSVCHHGLRQVSYLSVLPFSLQHQDTQ